jgi:hypothetical protein
MTETQRSATIQRILEYLQYNAGTAFQPEDLGAMLDCDPAEARTALDVLVAAGQIERREEGHGPVRYVANRVLEPDPRRRRRRDGTAVSTLRGQWANPPSTRAGADLCAKAPHAAARGGMPSTGTGLLAWLCR